MYRYQTPSCGSHQFIFTNCALHRYVKFPRPLSQGACVYCWGYAASVVNEWEWNMGGHDSDSRKRSTCRKTYAIVTLSTTDPTLGWPGIDSEPPRCEGNQSPWHCRPFHQITASGKEGCLSLAWSTLNWQKQNRNRSETVVHKQPTKHTHFLDVSVFCPACILRTAAVH
jgi:hypothetical protein